MVTWRALTGRHLSTAQCAQGTERKHRRLVEEELRESLKRAFQAYREPLDTVKLFKYLGRLLTVGDDNWLSVTGNRRKARKIWTQMTRILIRVGADPKVSGLFFKSAVHVVLLFWVDICVLTPRMDHSLSRFQHRVARRITGRQPRRRGGGDGSILRWRQQWGRRASRRLRST